MAKPALTFFFARSPIVDTKDGTPVFAFINQLNQWGTQLQNAFNKIGELEGIISADARIQGRTEGIGTTVGHIDDTGAALAPMVDFQRPYLNKTTDHIGDGTGSPLAGGTTAQQALTASAPTAGDFLEFDGTEWVPGQPSFGSLTGTIGSGQLPNSGATPGVYQNATVTVDATGRITSIVAGTGFSGTIVTAALTGVGTQGSMTFSNGILISQVAAT